MSLILKNILFPTDFSECANQALDHALHLAQSHKANLHMLHAIVLHGDNPLHPEIHFPEIELLRRKMEDAANGNLEATAKKINDNEIDITQVTERGISTAPVILEYVREHDIDLIVMGTHGHRGLSHLLLGSVAEEIVRFAPCPVLTVREEKSPKLPSVYRRILVPIDFSEHSKRSLSYAQEIARINDSDLNLLHVVKEDIHPAFYYNGISSALELMPEVINNARNELKNLFKSTNGSNATVTYHVLDGHIVDNIVNFAKNNEIDLIVISTHGLTGLQHMLLGSVAEKVIRHAPCPVFTFKAFHTA